MKKKNSRPNRKKQKSTASKVQPEQAQALHPVPPKTPPFKFAPRGTLTSTNRFSRYIWAENERLNRLIRELYLYFQLGRHTEGELYEHLCQQVARYFGAASCQLYLVTHEEEQEGRTGATVTRLADQRPPIGMQSDSTSQPETQFRLTRWLELVGASGPWKRALKQTYVRRRSRSRYELTPSAATDDKLDKVGLGSTLQGFLSAKPLRFSSRVDMPRATKRERNDIETAGSPPLREDVEHQVVWHNDKSYNSCRCVLQAPLLRSGRDETGRTADGQQPAERRLGLIKVENRIPVATPGFTEVPGDPNHTRSGWFPEMWTIAALRPYVRHLRGQLSSDTAYLESPLTNDVGWQQYYEDHPVGHADYEKLQDCLREIRNGPEKMVPAEQKLEGLRKVTERLDSWLNNLLECTIRLETWLSHLRFALRCSAGLGERPTLDEPHPSLFNIYNLRAAFLEELARKPERVYSPDWGKSPQNDTAVPLHETILKKLVEILPKRGQRQIIGLASLLTTLETVSIIQSGEMDNLEPNDGKNVIQRIKKGLAERRLTEECMKIVGIKETLARIESTALDHPRTLRLRIRDDFHTLNLLRLQAKGELSTLIDNLLEQKCATMNKNMFDSTFDITSIMQLSEINGEGDGLPNDHFLEAIQQVTDEIRTACEFLVGVECYSFDDAFELVPEQSDAQTLFSTSLAILRPDDQQNIWAASHRCSHPTGKHGDKFKGAACRVARLISASTMHADSFSAIDEQRIEFIASHVAQLLDAHLVRQARTAHIAVHHDGDQHGVTQEILAKFGADSFVIRLLGQIEHEQRQMQTLAKHFVVAELRRQVATPPDIVDEGDNVTHLLESNQVEWIPVGIAPQLQIQEDVERLFMVLAEKTTKAFGELNLEVRPTDHGSLNQVIRLQGSGREPDDTSRTSLEFHFLSNLSNRKSPAGSTADDEVVKRVKWCGFRIQVNVNYPAMQGGDIQSLWAAAGLMADANRVLQLATRGG